MEYSTQIDAARKGVITPQMSAAASKEPITDRELMELVATGQVVIPASKNHKYLQPCAIGRETRTKVNVNLGISKDCQDVESEMSKVRRSIELKADAIMDLSAFGKTEEFRKKLINISTVPVGTVPMYDAVGFCDKKLADIKPEEFISVVEKHARDGVDFMTIHAGLNREAVERFKKNQRLTNIVSRGGSLLFVWMELNRKENPFFEQFDDVLDICRQYDVTLSLGDALRPGCIDDATDAFQIQELLTLGELAKRAWSKRVQVMIEGPGHMKINEISANVMLEKKLCHGAPFYVLGPLVTDVAPGYDHITSAIGGAIAGASGADFLCYVTPAEHLRLPTLEDLEEGIIASRIAAHAADLAKGIKGAGDWDREMSTARKNLDWDRMFELALEPDKPRKYRENSKPEEQDTCTMCGNICAVRTMNRIIKGEEL
ncbi:MAG: phosphomethylpyrimidine synthase ThiC [Caldisericia bacterium]|nr:phosphomethylpyrimidine synthase ThiC [Caldisericia bacterium]